MSVPEVSVLEKVDRMKLADGIFLFRGEGCGLFCCPKLSLLRRMSQQFCPDCSLTLYLYSIGKF